MNKRWSFFFTGCFLFLIFVIFSYLVHKNVFTQFDFNTTVRLQDKISTRFDPLFSWFSTFGSFEFISVALVGILVFLLIQKKIFAILSGIFLYISFHVLELYGKFFVDHPPPPEFLLRTKRMVEFPQFHIRSEFSFPSGHSGRTIFMSVLLIILVLNSQRIRREIKWAFIFLIILFDLIMLISRVYLGEHWTTDVIGGGILGAGFGLITGAWIWRNTAPKKTLL